MLEAYRAIEEWFSENQYRKNKINDFESSLLNDTKVIWYEIDQITNPIRVFSRLNIGKIPLTSAELVKALLLKSRKRDDESISIDDKLELSRDWNQIENKLRRDDFWFFIANKEDEFINRIEFVLKLVADNYLKDIQDEEILKEDPLYTFLVFNACLQSGLNIKQLWQKVKEKFSILEEWFNDRELFNLIGYLIASNSSIK